MEHLAKRSLVHRALQTLVSCNVHLRATISLLALLDSRLRWNDFTRQERRFHDYTTFRSVGGEVQVLESRVA